MNDNNNDNHRPKTLRIKQQNCRKSINVSHSLLNLTDPAEYDIICIQEPYIYHASKHGPSSKFWTTHWAPASDTYRPSTATFINANISSSHIRHFPTKSPYLTIIELICHGTPILLINLYNPPESDDGITDLQQWIVENRPHQQLSNTILLGDFNKHHPMWSNPTHHTRHQPRQTELLLEVLLQNNLELRLPPDTLTFQSDAHRTWSTIDLVFSTPDLENRFIKCDASQHDAIPGADHLPVLTTLDTDPPRTTSQTRYNFRKTNWEDYRKHAENKLTTLLPLPPLESPTDMDNFAQCLTDALHDAITQTCPRSKPSPYQRRWWTSDIEKLQKEYIEARRRAFFLKGTTHERQSVIEEHKKRNKYNKVLKNSRKDMFNSFLEKPTEQDVWRAAKYATNPGADLSTQRIPTLVQKEANGQPDTNATDNQAKSEILAKTFFPPRPTDLPDSSIDSLPKHPRMPFELPSTNRICRAILNTKPHKAPGPDGIPNAALHSVADLIAPHLHHLLSATVRHGYFPKIWRHWTTIVIKKPNRPDYSLAKAYRPIALLNTLGYSRLPNRNYGGLPGRTTTDSLLYLEQTIKDAWRTGKVVTIIFLDIAAAFPNAVTERLLKNMDYLGIPEEIITFFRAMLSDRTTVLSFDDFTSSPFMIKNGIRQGDPASMILYLIYSIALITIPNGRNQDSGAFVDDTFFIAMGKTFQECDEILNDMLDKQEAFSRSHNSQAEVSKFQCLRLTRKSIQQKDFQRRNSNSRIECVKTAKLLGVIIDNKLRWHEQAQSAVRKGHAVLNAVARLTRPSFGLPPRGVHRLVTSIVIPKMEYALPVWLLPISTNTTGRRTGSIGHARKVGQVQRLATKMISGAYRSTATDLLNLHTNFLPIELRLNATLYRETTRLCSLPPTHPLHKIVTRCHRRHPRAHKSQIRNLLRTLRLNPDKIETINPVRKHPNWQPLTTWHIHDSKEKAATTIRTRLDDLKLFTDGSGYKDNVGASAVHYNDQTQTVLRYKLGSLKKHTVYEGELTGVLMALKIIDLHPRARTVLIGLDNQAAITSIHDNKRQPSQYIIDEIHQVIATLKKGRKRLKIHFEWTPGHTGVDGNEEADKEAKKAAEGDSSPPDTLPQLLRKPLPYSTSALKAAFNEKNKQQWKEMWKSSPRFERMNKIDESLPNTKIFKTLAAMNRRDASLLTQLRTGHIALNCFLKKIKQTNSALCTVCRSPETVPHFMLYCERYYAQRQTLRDKVQRAANTLKALLGNPKFFQDTANFVRATRRFKNFT